MRLLLALLLLLVPGCVGSAYQAPSDDEPHGVVIPGSDIFIWKIDGVFVRTGGETNLAPGRRRLQVRFQYDIESESGTPQEYKDLDLVVEPGDVYLLTRTGEGQFGPFDVEVKRAPRR